MALGAMRAGLAALAAALALACGGGGGSGGSALGRGGCAGSCAQVALSAAQVQTIVGQAVAEAAALGVAVTVAVVDHVGNVLAVYQMAGAASMVTIRFVATSTTGFEGLEVPSTLAAISKAGTAAYLSTQGNAFTTRTASQIVQEHFNPGEAGRPGGPLFGVQFSQLPCGDLVTREGLDARRGPKRMPLGFSADPGGIPLYLGGVPVGGVGVEFGGDATGPVEARYTADADISDFDVHREERIAVAASQGFGAPEDRRADRITVDGKFLRFADDETPQTLAVAALDPARLVAVAGFYPGLVFRDGVLFQTAASGVAATTFEGLEAEILVDNAGVNRFPPTAAGSAPGLTLDEVRVLLREALAIAARARAQIRRPLPTAARVTISVVGTDGEVLGLVRSRDAPVFGIDVSLQKARAAAFLSSASAGADLDAAGFGTIVDDVRAFLGDPTALANGIAFSNRALGNLARPFFPDGIDGNPNGPLSRPLGDWSPFSTGLQLDLVADGILAGLGNPALDSCVDAALPAIPNGIQIFPGSVPIYKGGDLVGGIGVSGDGVDQDDLIAFLGLHEAGQLLGTLGNAPGAIRADTLEVQGVNLRYVSCPPAPFIGSTEQSPCNGK